MTSTRSIVITNGVETRSYQAGSPILMPGISFDANGGIVMLGSGANPAGIFDLNSTELSSVISLLGGATDVDISERAIPGFTQTAPKISAVGGLIEITKPGYYTVEMTVEITALLSVALSYTVELQTTAGLTIAKTGPGLVGAGLLGGILYGSQGTVFLPAGSYRAVANSVASISLLNPPTTGTIKLVGVIV